MDRSTLIGMTTGAAVMFAFGIVWLQIGILRGRPSPAWLRLSLLFVGIALGASIVTLGMRASHFPLGASIVSPQQEATSRQISQHFYLIFGVELAAIFLAVVLLRAIGYPDHILCGIALIVGVHFIPLAALFKAPLYYWTGALGCAIAFVGFLMADASLRQKVVGISFGLLLWATSGWIACQGLSATPPVLQNLPPM